MEYPSVNGSNCSLRLSKRLENGLSTHGTKLDASWTGLLGPVHARANSTLGRPPIRQKPATDRML